MADIVWKEYELSELIDEIAMGPFGSNIKVECFTDSGVPVLNGSNLVGFRLNEDSFNYVTEEKANSLGRSNAYRGDVVVTHRGTLGQIIYIPQNSKFERYVISQSQFRIRCNDKVLPEYLVYYYHSRQGQYELLSNASQVGVPALARPTTTFQKLKIKIPQLEEQKRIAGILSSLDDKIELNNKINDNLEKQAQALFKNWFIDYAPFGGVMPDDWRELLVAELCDSISKTHDYNKKDLIFLNTGDIERGVFLHRNYSPVKDMPGQAKKSIKKNDILYSEIRPANGHYAFVDFDAEDYIVSTKLMVIRSNRINPYRLYNFLTSQDVVAELQTEADSRSGTFPQIRFENIQRLTMIIASEEIEAKFGEMLECIYKQVFANIKENQRLTTLRDTLLPKLMSGEIDVENIQI